MRGYMWIIVLLAFSSFCLGVAEFIVSGILTGLSLYYKILDSQAGHLASMYAIGVVIGAPIVSVLISAWNYRKQLFFTLIVFCISNIVVFVTDIFFIALIARFISGLMHGLFFVIAVIICIKVAPRGKTSMAISLMTSGLTIALVTGVPIGIFLSENYGLLSPFSFVASVSLCVSMASLFIMPKLKGKKAGFKNLGIAFKFAPLYQSFLITAFSCGSMFVVYIYLRVLLEKHGFSTESIKHVYLYYGIAAIFGNLFGGKMADIKGAFFSLCFILVILMVCLFLMSFSFYFSHHALVLNVALFAFFGFACITPLNMLCNHLAKVFTPKTQNDSIALNQGAFNVGIAFASFVGGAVQQYIDINFNGICAALFALSAFLILFIYIKPAYFKVTS